MNFEHECDQCHIRWIDSQMIGRCPCCGSMAGGTGLPGGAPPGGSGSNSLFLTGTDDGGRY